MSAGVTATAAEIRETLRRVLEPDARLVVAYLFGSAAQGLARPDSDVDVAVAFEEPTDPLDRFRLLGELEDKLRLALKKPVDVIDLFRAPPILLHQILLTGRPPALIRDERQWLLFENRARKIYWDMKQRDAVYDREGFK